MLFLDLLHVVLDLDAHVGVVLEVHEHVVVNLDVVIDDVDLVREDRDLRGLGRRRRGLLGNGNHFFDFNVLVDIQQVGNLLVLRAVGERSPDGEQGYDESDLREEKPLVLETGLL